MTRPADDTRLHRALSAAPQRDATDAEVAEVMRRAAARDGRTQRRVAALIAILVVGLAVLALPPGRSALASVVGGLQEFFQGGDAPGKGRPPLDVDLVLDDVAPGGSRVLATQGDLSLVGYRQAGTSWPCIGLAPAAAVCAAGDRWATRTAGHAVVVVGASRPRQASGVVVWGLAQDGVATIDMIDTTGATERATVGANAFLLVVPPGRTPRTLVARDRTGLVMERTGVGRLSGG